MVRHGSGNQIVESVRRESYVVAQEYLKAAEEGDMQLFMMNGRPLRGKKDTRPSGACVLMATLAAIFIPGARRKRDEYLNGLFRPYANYLCEVKFLLRAICIVSSSGLGTSRSFSRFTMSWSIFDPNRRPDFHG